MQAITHQLAKGCSLRYSTIVASAFRALKSFVIYLPRNVRKMVDNYEQVGGDVTTLFVGHKSRLQCRFVERNGTNKEQPPKMLSCMKSKWIFVSIHLLGSNIDQILKRDCVASTIY